ncbi:hypothetical protein ACJJTC_002217 [Scirpophaga incertulas]
MGCGEFIVKYILFFANLFFALAGLVLLGLGVAAQLQIKSLGDMLAAVADGQLQIAPITAMAVGSVVFLIAFFGCCGAIRESHCMLVTFAIFMLVLMVIKIALATVIFVGMERVLAEIPKWLGDAFASDVNGFHEIEKTFKCCGPNGALSYGRIALPETCCASSPCLIINAYSGCNAVLNDFFSTFGLVIGIVAIVVGAIELVAAVFGLCLANHVRNKYRRSRY